MQVSWIDPKMLKALVEQIAPQEEHAPAAQTVMEIETAPEGAAAWEPVPEFALGEVNDDLAGSLETAGGGPAFAPEMRVEPEVETAGEPDGPVADALPAEEHDSHGHALRNPAAALPLSRIRDKLRAIRQRAAEAGILTRPSEAPLKAQSPVEAAVTGLNDENNNHDATVEESSPAPEPGITSTHDQRRVPSFEIPRGSQAERLAAFAGWARQVLREDGGHVLVMSDDGEVLWGGEAKAGLVLSTMMAWGSAIRAGASAACAPPPVMRQSLASGHVLTVIPCQTVAGVVHAAVAAPDGLADDVALVLREALCVAMSAETLPRQSV